MLYIVAEIEYTPELFPLHCAAHTIPTQESLPTPPSPSELQTFGESVTLFMSTPDSLNKEAMLELQRLQRQLQSHCLGLLETWEKSYNDAREWASHESRELVGNHGVSQFRSYHVSFMHSTVRDFLVQNYTQRKLKKEAFDVHLALLNGTLVAFRKNNRLSARWLLTTYNEHIWGYFIDGIRFTDDEEGFHSAFENINKIVGAIRKAIADYFSGQDFSLMPPEHFWQPISTFTHEEEGRETTVGDTDDLSVAVFLGYHTYLESRLIRLDEQSRSKRATDLLVECFIPRKSRNKRIIKVSPDAVKVLLRHGADPDARITVAAETCLGQDEMYPEWTALPVWVYVLGCAWAEKKRKGLSFRTSASMSYICNAVFSFTYNIFGVLPRSNLDWGDVMSQTLQEMLNHGAQTDFELQFGRKKAKEVKQGTDSSLASASSPELDGNEWYWEDAGTFTASEMISTLVPDFPSPDR